MTESMPDIAENQPWPLNAAEQAVSHASEEVEAVGREDTEITQGGDRHGEDGDNDSEEDKNDDDDSNGNDANDDEGNDDEDDDGESESDAEPVPTLVEGRERRSTAGNRLSKLLDQEGEGEDDEVTMLFADTGDEDVDFEDPDAVEASDADDDSSTDDEDHGPTAGEDDLEGERQLVKEERNERKRKAKKPFLKAPTGRKRVKIDESATPSSAVEQTPKKLERRSWIHKAMNAPKRTSSRTLSIQNKERTLASMKENEKRRVRQQAVLEATQRRREAERNKPMTQEERLEEAARTEELNSKSLNRWEEMERDRMAKQRARLEALQNRKLEGPVIRWYSGPAEWVDGTLQRVGKNKTQPKEAEEDSEAAQASLEDSTPAQDHIQDAPPPAIDTNQPNNKSVDDTQVQTNRSEKMDSLENAKFEKEDVPLQQQPTIVTDVEDKVKDLSEEGQDKDRDKDSVIPDKLPAEEKTPAQDVTGAASIPTERNEPMQDTFLEDIYRYASIEEASKEDETQLPSTTGNDEKPETLDQVAEPSHSHHKDNEPEDSAVAATAKPPSSHHADEETGEKAAATAMIIDKVLETPEATQESIDAQPQNNNEVSETLPTSRQATPKVEYSARNLISLMNFDQNAIRDRDVQRRVLFKWRYDQVPATSHSGRGGIKTAPLQPAPRSSCAITHQSARYKDPETGLPYANLDSYRAIRRLVAGGCRWSDLLGAWVGGEVPAADGNRGVITAARGVPPGFERPLPPQTERRDEGSNMNGAATAVTNEGNSSLKVEGT